MFGQGHIGVVVVGFAYAAVVVRKRQVGLSV